MQDYRPAVDTAGGGAALEDDRAGAAVALGTAFLSSTQLRIAAQPVEKRRRRVDAIRRDRFIVEQESDAVAHRGSLRPSAE
jgi:hypothetical protein